MATKKQNDLWNSLFPETKKQMKILYVNGKINKEKVEFLETLYGKENLEKYK